MEIDKIHGTFSLKKLRNAMKREEIDIGFNFQAKVKRFGNITNI